jgi:pimeloyl-ACP methyl ester carboxylesterase
MPFVNNSLPVAEKVVAIENAGHCPREEIPDITNSIILNYLRRCKPC